MEINSNAVSYFIRLTQIERRQLVKLVFILIGCFVLWSCATSAQVEMVKKKPLNEHLFSDYFQLDTLLKEKYPFIQFEKNNFTFFTEESPTWEHLYQNMQTLIKAKDRKLNFYHVGGSHVQADIYTSDIRTKLQTTWEGIPGERGWVFPFGLAKSNNPSNYEFHSPNNWKSFRSVAKDRCSTDFGLLGAIVSCPDSSIDIRFRQKKKAQKAHFSRLRIYHNKGLFPYEMHFGPLDSLVTEKRLNSKIGYTDIFFSKNVDSFDLHISKTTKKPFDIHLSAFQLTNMDPGISYTAIGVNGAALFTYLNCGNFEEQLKLSAPDFFAFSVGTNDANVPYEHFRPEVYKENMESMIKIVLNANPRCAILLTVPNDSYYHKVSLNRNISRQRQVINELAVQYQIPVWDLYGLMGELGSSKTWYRSNLMKEDLVHFTPTGYHLKGDLYFDAFLKWMEQMEQR